jgi:hypothetical protein
MDMDSERRLRPRTIDSEWMNARRHVEELPTPQWVRRANAGVYVTLSRAAGRWS